MKTTPLLVTTALTLSLAACVQDQSAMQDREVEPPSTQVLSPVRPPEKKHQSAPSVNARERELHALDWFASAPPPSNPSFAAESVARFDLQSMRQPLAPSVNREVYGQIPDNGVRLVSEDPVSTFSIDVDTGAYAVLRRHLNDGLLPPGNAVRIEEMVNYFDYDYPSPPNSDVPFSVTTELAATPWNRNTHLLKVGLQGYRVEATERVAANLVFLIDVSGSMNSANKLPLLKNAFRLLTDQLTAADTVTLVVYAGSSGVVLETTAGDRKATILAAIDRLSAGGSTHGSSGIKLAYAMAEQALIKDGINRVILATDGDFNVGTVNHDALIDLIERNRDKGIALTTLGFGNGNYNDHLMEQLADHGDGNYAYIDNLNEARKTLVEQVSATLQTIARDVKIQIEWNPARVAEYRLIGYENRMLQREDFNNDRVDAGDIGAGHNVTALYEITLTDAATRRIDGLRYQRNQDPRVANRDELAMVKLRFKQPEARQSQLIEHVVNAPKGKLPIARASDDLQFAAAVAAFGDLLRGGKNLQNYGYADILQQAQAARGKDSRGYRAEFIGLVELASALDSRG